MSREHALRHAQSPRYVWTTTSRLSPRCPGIKRLVRGEPALKARPRVGANDDQLVMRRRRSIRSAAAAANPSPAISTRASAVQRSAEDSGCREPPVHRHRGSPRQVCSRQTAARLPRRRPVEVGHPVAGPAVPEQGSSSVGARPPKQLAIPLHHRERVAPARRITSATRRSSPLRIEGQARGDERRSSRERQVLGRVQVARALEDLEPRVWASDRRSARHWPPGCDLCMPTVHDHRRHLYARRRPRQLWSPAAQSCAR